MLIKPKNPWESSFENLTASVAKPVKKAVTDAAKVVAGDVREQITGDYKKDMQEQMGVQERTEEDKKRILAESASMKKELEEKIERARKMRIRKEQASSAKATEAKEKAAAAKATAAKNEPIWQKMMKMGSQAERKVNAGG